MKFGVGISTCREGLFYPVGFASPSNLLYVTQKAEELGYDSVWGNDHITTQSYVKKRGEHPNFFEPMVILAYLASQTRSIKLGTGVVVAPIRNPVTLAKQAITLDHLSGGRFVLGIGLGAYREEFESFGGRGNRGEILNEGIQALNLLFSDKTCVSFEGRHFSFKDIEMFPKPLSKPFPLYIGGNASEVVRRVGMFGEGWLPAAMSPEALGKSIEKIAEYARKNGRDPHMIEVAPEAICGIAHDPGMARKAFQDSLMYHHLLSLRRSTLKDVPTLTDEELLRRNFIGSPDEIIRKIEEYQKVGARHLWFDFIGWTIDEVVDRMELFAREVMPSFKKGA